MAKLKRGRGRPTAEMAQIYAMDAAQTSVKEMFAENYLDAMKFIVTLVNDEKASSSLRLQAAKTVKEQVEEWLEEHYASLEDEEPEIDEDIPAKKIKIS